jgi:hypothetical protein
MDKGDEIDSLPTDSNEPLAHMELSSLQKMFKKKGKATLEMAEISTSHPIMVELKTTLIATVLFLLLSHPKFDGLLHSLSLDTFTVYGIKALIFASLFFIVKYKLS